MQRCWVLFAILVLPTSAAAQAERFEVGQRLRELERTWDTTKNMEGKRRAIQPLNQAVLSFFSSNFGGVGEALDKARHALLATDAPPFDIRWGESLFVELESKLVDVELAEMAVVVRPLYKVDGQVPKDAKARLRIGANDPVELTIADVPRTAKLPLAGLKSGDWTFQYEVLVSGKAVVSRTVNLSRVENLVSRLSALRKYSKSVEPANTVERATLRHLLTILSDLAEKKVPETNFPAAKLLTEAEAIAEASREETTYYSAAKSGQFWLRVPAGKSAESIRIFVPEGLQKTKPVPIVFALHGMGGSENLFFDGYGDGITAKICKERGWIMVATNAGGGLGFGSPPNVISFLDELLKRYPIDTKRVYLVGHSMGAAHVVAIAQQTPNRFAGAAALGGGGLLNQPDALKTLPFFIGYGKADFAAASARSLADALKKVSGEKMQVKEYDDIEHMMIVREAILDVFKFWDGK